MLATWMYRPREFLLTTLKGVGPLLVAGALAAAAAYSLRIGFFLLFFFLYFGGYPALQFAARHYFHLEFITWWAAGFLAYHAVRRRAGTLSLKRLGIFAAIAAVLVLLPWGVLRLYQRGQARRVLNGMVDAAKTPIRLPSRLPSRLVPMQGPTEFGDVRLLEVDVNRWACGASPSITFRYDAKEPDYDFSRTVSVPPGIRAHEPTRVFVPVFSRVFQGVEFSPDAAGCVAGAYWVDTDHRPLVLAATLEPGWESQALYQRLWFEPGSKIH
jgi:hypothetical protein